MAALLLVAHAAAVQAGGVVRYLSPVPGARNILPQTNVIVRYEGTLAGPAAAWRIDALGSASGPHAGTLAAGDDGRTLLLQPGTPFVPGESVTVTVTPPATGPDATEPGVSFSFSIAASRPRLAKPASLLLLEREPRPAQARPVAGPDSSGSGVPIIASSVYSTPAPGRLFLASLDFSLANPAYLLILDDFGDPLFSRRMPLPCFDFKPQPNGLLTYYDETTLKFYALDSSYAVVDSFACGNGYETDVHELRLLPNGHALLLGDDPETVDMSAVVPGGNPAATVIGIILQELDPHKNVVFEWRSWDHFQITDATHEDLTAPLVDYVHSNAIEVDADGNLLLSSRHLDEITKIDRKTGDIVWRWGGLHNQFAFVGDTLAFSHQHALRLLGNGHYTLFDNGNYHDPPFSRALEYVLDQDAMTATLVWQFVDTPPGYSFAMGYVQRLDNGNTLIGWGFGKPDLTEVAPDGTKVMEMTLPQNLYSYRAFRADWEPGTLSAGTPPPPPVSLGVAPNPFRSETNVVVRLARPATISMRVFDVTGRQVLAVLDRLPRAAGVYPVELECGSLPAGVYLCRVEAAGRSESRKLVIER